MNQEEPKKMDLRKIQITGGSSFMVTLPKDWAESVGIRKNDTVGLQPQPDGSLVLYPGGEQAAVAGSVRTVEADGVTDGDFLYRMLVGAYIAGHDTIVLRSESGLSSMAASIASSFAQTAIGLEIMEESDESIVMRDLMDKTEMRPTRSVERMKVLVRNMLNDTMDGLESKDKALLGGLVDRDREVDRLDWLISRQVNIHQRDITISRRMGTDLCEITRCNSIGRALERIGDHAVLLATNLRPIIDDPTPLDSEILAAGRDAVTLMVDSVGTWPTKDMRSANECIRRGEALVARAEEISSKAYALEGQPSAAAELIAASVRRVAEYSMDIAEIAINSAMDRSEGPTLLSARGMGVA